MNKLLTTLAVALGVTLSTGVSAFAADFKNNELTVVASSETLDYRITSDRQNGLDEIGVGLYAFPYSMGDVNATLYTELYYSRSSETLNVDLEYQVRAALNPKFTGYGALGVLYTVDAGSAVGNSWTFDPYVGVNYDVNEKLYAFAEVGNSWDMKNDFNNLGGYAEIGIGYSLTDTVYLQPSIIKPFNTGNDSAVAKLEVGFAF